MKVFSKRTWVLFGVIAAVAALASVGAYAYWTTSGSGTGSAATGTSQNVTVSQLGTISGLVPGGPAGAIDYRINNPASYNQYVASVSVVVDPLWSAQADASKPACTAADFTISGSPDSVAADLATGDHDYQPSGMSIALDNEATNQDNCKSVNVPLLFSANAS
jgi:hypothetical protein